MPLTPHLFSFWRCDLALFRPRPQSAQLCRALDDERRGKPTVHVIEEGDVDAIEFYQKLGGTYADVQSADVAGDASWEKDAPAKRIYRLSDGDNEGKEMEFVKVAEGQLDKAALDSSECVLLHPCAHCGARFCVCISPFDMSLTSSPHSFIQPAACSSWTLARRS